MLMPLDVAGGLATGFGAKPPFCFSANFEARVSAASTAGLSPSGASLADLGGEAAGAGGAPTGEVLKGFSY
jgi:hypothetical protein